MVTGENDIVRIESNQKEEIKNNVFQEVNKRSKSVKKTAVFSSPKEYYEFKKTIEDSVNIFSSWTDVLSCLRLSQNQNDFKHYPKSLPWFNPDVKDMKSLFESCHIKKTRQFAASSCIYYFVLHIEEKESNEEVINSCKFYKFLTSA